MTKNIELLRDQFLALLDHWDELINSDPSKAAHEARIFLRWLERYEPTSAEATDLRTSLWIACLEIISSAEACRR